MGLVARPLTRLSKLHSSKGLEESAECTSPPVEHKGMSKASMRARRKDFIGYIADLKFFSNQFPHALLL
ncbi:unnamed protein product [Toxocara canis]|uniref:Uncharacterized protein n=1 Tax=Toxocara canis TaxID=6265 RepID=A0A183U1F6_TOXCA|nr:unnamed protein product [Toxocara canis]